MFIVVTILIFVVFVFDNFVFNIFLFKVNRNSWFFNFFNYYILLNNKLLFLLFNLISCYNFLNNNYEYINKLKKFYNNNIIFDKLDN